jgi:hypothetical protein
MNSTEFHRYPRDEFLGAFFPGPSDKAIAAGMEQLQYSRIRPVGRMPVPRLTGTGVRLKVTPCGKDFLS